MQGFNFVFTYRVGVADINYGGHVSNSAVLNFFQDARIAYLANLGPFSEIELGGCGIIMPEAHVYYHREMFLGDTLSIGVLVDSIKRSGWTMKYRIERDDVVVADGETPIVCYDYTKGKACRIPAEFRAALVQFENLEDRPIKI